MLLLCARECSLTLSYNLERKSMIDTKNECTSRLYVHDDHLIMNAEMNECGGTLPEISGTFRYAALDTQWLF